MVFKKSQVNIVVGRIGNYRLSGIIGSHLVGESDHAYCRHGSLIALVAKSTTTARTALFDVVVGEDTKDIRNLAQGIESSETLGNALRYEIEMGRFATNDATETDDGVNVSMVSQQAGSIGQFESTGNVVNKDVVTLNAIANEGIDTTTKETACDFGIPITDDNAKRHV